MYEKHFTCLSVNKIINFRLPWSTGNFLTSRLSFPSATVYSTLRSSSHFHRPSKLPCALLIPALHTHHSVSHHPACLPATDRLYFHVVSFTRGSASSFQPSFPPADLLSYSHPIFHPPVGFLMPTILPTRGSAFLSPPYFPPTGRLSHSHYPSHPPIVVPIPQHPSHSPVGFRIPTPATRRLSVPFAAILPTCRSPSMFEGIFCSRDECIFVNKNYRNPWWVVMCFCAWLSY